MSDTNFRLCWETFRNNLSDGFSKLQQMQEFVDVTLAAGGHFVKAHQNIIAVASPYLKEMLKSTPCKHPVIFLGILVEKMSDTNFRLCWETFRNNLSDGFSKLQQMQEFVDVTLAAGGHFVKAHQNIIAVASPYLKEMLKSTPCKHPVIFLGPVNHTVLCFILEYIYTGEVNVPSHVLPAFVEAAKLLHIAGIKDIQLPQVNTRVKTQSEAVNKKPEEISVINTTFNEQHSELEVNNLVNNGENVHTDNYESTVNPDEPLDNNEKSDMDLDYENIFEMKNILICPVADTQVVQPTNYIEGNSQPLENYEKCDSELDFEHTSPGDQPTNNIEGNSQPLDSDANCDSDLDFENFIQIKKIQRFSVNDTPTLQRDQLTNTLEENLQTSDNNDTCDLDLDFKNLIKIKRKPSGHNVDTLISQGNQPTKTIEKNPKKKRKIEHEPKDYTCETVNQVHTASEILNNDCNDVTEISKEPKKNEKIPITPLYTRSNRGSLQMVLNRFVYYLHHTSFAKQKRRWRCINYRRQHCTAYVDTNGEIILCRTNPHNHPFLDDEILKIGRRKQFFTSIAEANDRQHQETNIKATKITDKTTEDQKNYEIKIEFGKVSITK